MSDIYKTHKLLLNMTYDDVVARSEGMAFILYGLHKKAGLKDA